MSKLEETIKQLQQDLIPLQISREEYLAICVLQRLEKQNSKYDNQFDKLLKIIEQDNIYKFDFIKTANNLKIYSELISVLYKNLVDYIKNFENFSQNFT